MLFIHDHTFLEKDGRYYTTGSLNQQVMNRYKRWFGKVDIFATTRSAEKSDKDIIRNENLVDHVGFKLIVKKKNFTHYIKCLIHMKEAVKGSNCVIVRMSIFGAIGVFYARRFKKPYLVEMVACPWDSLWYHSLKGKFFAPFMTLLTKVVCKNAPYVIYVTNSFLQRRYPTNGITIGCSDVELSDINVNLLAERISKIESMNSDQMSFKLCTVANVGVKYKGQEIVINAIKKLDQVGINCDYYLVGGGNNSRLKKVAEKTNVKDKVHFIGSLPHGEIFNFIDNMDLYIQPSKQEGLPRAVIEAMSRACPVIGARTGGIPELISQEFVFKKGSKESFIDIIKCLSKEKMVVSAKENLDKSKEYQKSVLDIKRNDFYLDFANAVKGVSK